MPNTVRDKSFIMDIDTAYMFPVLKDTTEEMTYGAGIKIDGIQSLKLTPNYITKELKGDARKIDVYSKLDNIEFTVEHAQLNLVATAAQFGFTYNSANGLIEMFAESLPKEFGFWWLVKYTEVAKGYHHGRLAYCKATKFDIQYQNEEFAKMSFTAQAFGPKNFVTEVNGEKLHKIGDMVFLPGTKPQEIPSTWPTAWPPTTTP